MSDQGDRPRGADGVGSGGAGEARGEPPYDLPARVAVLASGSGTNLQALLDRFNLGTDDVARVVRVIGSKAGIGALERARRADVEPVVLEEPPGEDAEALLAHLEAAEADLVVLAGYLRMVPDPVVAAYRGRMVNIHPALLPAFGGEGMYGLRVHQAVLDVGARVTGVTVHFVNEEYDAGSIIAQWPVPVLEGDDPERLAGRVLEVEHGVLPEVVAALATGRVRRERGEGARWREAWFDGERFQLDGRSPTG